MSYGTNAPQGLQAVSTLNGAPWTASIRTFNISSAYATSLFNGDPVQAGNDGTVKIGATSTASLGVFTGCEYIDSLNVVQKRMFWPASTATATNTLATANVITDPNTIYDIQSSGDTSPYTVALTNTFNTANLYFGTGSTLTGYSGVALDTSTAGSGNATYNVKILGLTPNASNSWGQLYNNALVMINNHFFRAGVAGV
jgi:hypothetical protein